MWIWDQSAGTLSRDGAVVGRGYAGRGRGVNNPAMQAVKSVGPLPAGRYKMTDIRDSANTGPRTIVLDPMPGTDTFGRSAFRIHGDNRLANKTASRGCIILPRALRLKIWASGDRELQVVA